MRLLLLAALLHPLLCQRLTSVPVSVTVDAVRAAADCGAVDAWVRQQGLTLLIQARVSFCDAPWELCWSVEHGDGDVMRCVRESVANWTGQVLVNALQPVHIGFERPDADEPGRVARLTELAAAPDPPAPARAPLPLPPAGPPLTPADQSRLDCTVVLACRARNVTLRGGSVWLRGDLPELRAAGLYSALLESEVPFALTTSRRTWTARTEGVATDTVEIGLGARLEEAPGAEPCRPETVMVVSIPYPQYYWHAVVEGVLPIASAIAQLDGPPPRIALTHEYGGHHTLPRPVRQMLEALTPYPLTTVAALEGQCLRDALLGHYPPLITREHRAAGIALLAAALGLPAPPPAAEGAPLRVTVAQRRRRVNSAYPGHEGMAPVRSLTNADELVRAAARLGHTARRFSFEELSAREQLAVMAATDVFVSAHGGGFTNAAFLPGPATAAIQLVGYGMREICPTLLPTYRISNYGNFDCCEHMWYDVPDLPPGRYLEWAKPTAEGFGYPFRLWDFLCDGDGDSPECVEEARRREAEVLANPRSLWESDRLLAHFFIKNQNLEVPVPDFVRLLDEAEAVVRVRRRWG